MGVLADETGDFVWSLGTVLKQYIFAQDPAKQKGICGLVYIVWHLLGGLVPLLFWPMGALCASTGVK